MSACVVVVVQLFREYQSNNLAKIGSPFVNVIGLLRRMATILYPQLLQLIVFVW
jgi:hypothetical protein